MEHLYSFVEKYAKQYHLSQTLVALPYGKKMHDGQYRKGKEKYPYYCHPLKMACHAIAIGIQDDDIMAASLLHDVCEDCGVAPEDLPVGEKVKEIVAFLTRDFEAEMKSEENEKSYYDNILNHKETLLVKLLDRCNNVSEMSVGFTDERMERYISKTEKWFYPMMEQGLLLYPEYEREIFLIQYHMTSVMDAAKRCLDKQIYK